MTLLRVYVGWDPREELACRIAVASMRQHQTQTTEVRRIAMQDLVARGLYRRPTGWVDDTYWDEISDAPMSTGHAIARFLVPYLCDYDGLALFVDGDVLFRADVAALFALADPAYAVQVVQHDYQPTEGTKKDGQIQTRYARKNWSSVMLFNCGHPANRRLTVDWVNEMPGRDLHRFCWLTDAEVGALPPQWNWLAGHSSLDLDPALVHFTSGLPSLPGYADQPYAEEWRAFARRGAWKPVEVGG